MDNNLIDKSAIIEQDVIIGDNVVIGENTVIKKGTQIESGSIIGKNCIIGESSYIDFGVIIRDSVTIGSHAFVGARSILGEFLVDFVAKRECIEHPLIVGENAIIRSETIIYGDSVIGSGFQTGHRVTVRERSILGNNVRVGTLSDIQGFCEIGDYVNLHSNVHVGQKSKIEDYVWLFPYVVLTNDPNPPSNDLQGVTVKRFAVVSTGAIVLPGITINEESLVGAGAIVTKDVERDAIVVGNPAKVVGKTQKIKNKITGEPVYPWKYTFDRGMPWEGIGYTKWLTTQDIEEN